jgi:hypothetical protein
MINATPKQLRKAANLQEKIQLLQGELNSLLGGSDETDAMEAPRKRRRVSAAGRARMRAAQIARWAKIKGTAPKRKKGKMSVQGLANIRAAQKARWAKVKAGKVPQPRRQFSAAGRARLAALAKARWAEAKKAGKSRL